MIKNSSGKVGHKDYSSMQEDGYCAEELMMLVVMI